MCVDKGSGQCPVVSIHDEVDRRESAEGSLLTGENFVGVDSNPVRVEVGRREHLVSGVGTDVEIIESELFVQ